LNRSVMILNIKLFAILKDRVGEDHITLEVQSPIQAKGLKNFIKDRFSDIGEFMEVTRVAVNEEFVSDSHVINEGDIIALIPPSSGG